MPDLSTTYLGLALKSPLVASASPLSKSLDNVKRLEDAGAAAIVMYSLFEEQINAESNELDYFLTHGTESYAEALSYFPEMQQYRLGPEQYLDHVRRIKAAVRVPVIGSLNGVSRGGADDRAPSSWVKYAQKIEQAGADALELNVYFVPTDPMLASETIEQIHVELLQDVKRSVRIPVAMKIGPYFTNMTHIARRLDRAGVNGLVLFNRFFMPDFDLEALEVVPRIGLSTSYDLRLPLRWIAILYGHLQADMALTSGVHTAADALKGLMAGATVTMMASELLQNGIQRLTEIQQDMERWMEEHEYASVTQMRGSMSHKSVAFPAAFERALYVKALTSYEIPRR